MVEDFSDHWHLGDEGEHLAVVLVDVSIGMKGEALENGAAAFARRALARRKRQAVLERSGERQFVSAKEGCASSSSSPRFFNRRTVRVATVSSNGSTSSSSGGGSEGKGAVLVVSRAGATKRLSGHEHAEVGIESQRTRESLLEADGARLSTR